MNHKIDDQTGQVLAEALDVWIRAKALDVVVRSLGVSDRNPAMLPEVVAKAQGLEIYISDGAEAYLAYVQNGGMA